MKTTALEQIDLYKADHRRQYPENTTMVYSNFTPRSTKLSNLPKSEEQKIVFFGLQYFIQDFLIDTFNETFFNRPKDEVIQEYSDILKYSLHTDMPTDHIAALHDLGYLPLEIFALPEGTQVKEKTPVLTIRNTHPDFFWLVNYIETVMSTYLWKATTSATTAKWYKDLFDKYAKKTSSTPEFTAFQGHDFSFRGMSSPQDALISGMGHLTSFKGTDTLPAIKGIQSYYWPSEETFVGGSIPATEHSVMCSGGKENELQTYKRLINDIYPNGMVSIVSDTWDYWNVLTNHLPKLKDDIMKRDGKVVIRPDSGDPVRIICGSNIKDYTGDKLITTLDDLAEDVCEEIVEKETDEAGHGEQGSSVVWDLVKWNDKYYNIKVSIEWNRYDKQYYFVEDSYVDSIEEDTISPEQKGTIEVLWDLFGGTVNDKGYKELDPHIGVIYGDSITPERAEEILKRLEAKGFASTNIVFGIGSFTYQYVTRDTYGFAVKATYAEIDGKGVEIFKDPKTDSGVKKSARGLIRVVDGELMDQQTWEDLEHGENDMSIVFQNGYDLDLYSGIDQIRKRLESS